MIHGHLAVSSANRRYLLLVNAATADRLLRTSRNRSQGRGISMAKPGGLLKRQIQYFKETYAVLGATSGAADSKE